jgi:hypothetical protein
VLARGEHTLTFRCNEPGARLAQLIITDDKSFVPAEE